MANTQQFGFQADAPAQQQGFGFEEDEPTKKPKAAQAQQMPLTEQIESLLAAPGQTLLEAGQTLSRIVQGLPGAQPLARGIVGALPEPARRGLAALQVKGDILPQAPAPVKFGGALLGGGTAAELGGEALAPALEAIPGGAAITKLAQRFPRLARTAATTAFGALTSPGQRFRGAALGAGLGAGAEAVGAAPQIAKFGIQKAKALLSPFAAETDAQNILRKLGQNRSLEENSKSMALDIKNKSEEIEKESDKKFSPVFDKVGEKLIYKDLPKKEPSLIQLLPGTLIKEKKEAPIDLGEYNKLPKSIIREFTPDLKQLHNEFIKKPTFRNAANLRTELGAESARPGIDVLSRRAKQSVTKARQSLNNDMFSFLNRTDKTGNLADKYQDAVDFHRNEYVPYKSHRQIWKIAKGEVKNPRNITTIFKAPEGEEEGENFTKTAKVLNDLGVDANKKILFNELGKAKNAKDLINRFKNLDRQRLGSYVTPDLRGSIEGLEAKVGRKEIAQRAAGGLGGAALGSLSGFPIIGTTTGATLGATVLPRLLRGLGRRAIRPTRGITPVATQRLPRNLQFLIRSMLAARANQQNR